MESFGVQPTDEDLQEKYLPALSQGVEKKKGNLLYSGH